MSCCTASVQLCLFLYFACSMIVQLYSCAIIIQLYIYKMKIMKASVIPMKHTITQHAAICKAVISALSSLLNSTSDVKR